MTGADAITERDLLAYADDRLPAERRARVEAWLAERPKRAAEVAAWRRQNGRLKALYGSVADEPVPDRLSVHGLAASAAPPTGIWVRRAAAILLVLGLGVAGGWLARGSMPLTGAALPGLVDEAVAAHSLYAGEVVHPVEVRAAEENHLKAWLSKRLDRPLTVPNLETRGFRLVGGRLLPAGRAPAAQFMYQNAAGVRVTLYIVPAKDAGETSFRYAQLDKLEAFFWNDETIRCALVGDLPKADLHTLALDAYRQLG